MLIRMVLMIVCGGMVAQSAWAQPAAHPLVNVQRGDLPIILSAPHGGSQAIAGAAERTGQGVRQFRNRTDLNTRTLAQEIANALQRKTGKRPYLVVAKFHRKYADANRRPLDAYESSPAQQAYDAYHQALSDARRQVEHRWQQGILLDIHGQAANPQAIYRGTQNGATVSHLLKHHGRAALIGPGSLFGQLAKQDFSVVPNVDLADQEHPSYDGGYIVVTYGSDRGGTVDAIQLELGRDLRSADQLATTADRIANALVAFAENYLPGLDVDRSSVPLADPPKIATSRLSSQGAIVNFHFDDQRLQSWRLVDSADAELSVAPTGGKLTQSPALRLQTSDDQKASTLMASFPSTGLPRVGDRITLQFDAMHDALGFHDQAFQFGLFGRPAGGQTPPKHLPVDRPARPFTGWFAEVDLGSRTTRSSAILRRAGAASQADPSLDSLWHGPLIARDDNDALPDPLMFTRQRKITFWFVIERGAANRLDLFVRNSVSGDSAGLLGTVDAPADLQVQTVGLRFAAPQATLIIDQVCVSQQKTETEPNASSVNVGVYVGKGVGGSFKDLLFELEKLPGLNVHRLAAEDVEADQLKQLDVLIHPGGSGSGQARALGPERREAVRRFVADGGGYIGICAGSYLASADYEWSLGIMDAKVVDRKHWNRGTGTVSIEATEQGASDLLLPDSELQIYYGQGPLLAPGNHDHIEDFQTLATYKTEVVKNGASPGVMIGTVAMAKGGFGQGAVICYSPHPELTVGLESLLERAIKMVARKTKGKGDQ